MKSMWKVAVMAACLLIAQTFLMAGPEQAAGNQVVVCSYSTNGTTLMVTVPTGGCTRYDGVSMPTAGTYTVNGALWTDPWNYPGSLGFTNYTMTGTLSSTASDITNPSGKTVKMGPTLPSTTPTTITVKDYYNYGSTTVGPSLNNTTLKGTTSVINETGGTMRGYGTIASHTIRNISGGTLHIGADPAEMIFDTYDPSSYTYGTFYNDGTIAFDAAPDSGYPNNPKCTGDGSPYCLSWAHILGDFDVGPNTVIEEDLLGGYMPEIGTFGNQFTVVKFDDIEGVWIPGQITGTPLSQVPVVWYSVDADGNKTLLSGLSGSFTDDGTLIVDRVPSVPEPSTILLLGLGLISLAGIRRKNTKIS
jgi:hypothetical protein